jgi:GNAT superfamily N-acetyltransferase
VVNIFLMFFPLEVYNKTMHSFPPNYELLPIRDPDDPWLPDWLNLYELTFPPEERFLAGELLRLLQDPARRPLHHWLALIEAGQRLTGLGLWQSLPEVATAYLWYLAVQPGLRGGGLGAALYQSILASALETHPLLIFEVELPELAPDEAARQLRERRIAFYRRQGARLLGGVHYLETVGPHLPPVPMHLMAQGRGTLDPTEVFKCGKALFDDLLTQTGELSLR